MLANDVRKYVIKPTLEIAAFWSESAEILIYGTGMIQTGYQFLAEEDRLGFWQMTSMRYSEILKWVRKDMSRSAQDRLLSSCYYVCFPSDPKSLISNLRLGCLMSMLHYYKTKEDIPAYNDSAAMTSYYLKHYDDKLDPKDVFKRIIEGHV